MKTREVHPVRPESADVGKAGLRIEQCLEQSAVEVQPGWLELGRWLPFGPRCEVDFRGGRFQPGLYELGDDRSWRERSV